MVMTVLGVLTKLWGCGLGAKLNGFSRHSNYLVGAGMISRGEMALITAQIGLSAHLLSNDYYSDIILVIIVVTMIAPFVLKNAIHRAVVWERMQGVRWGYWCVSQTFIFVVSVNYCTITSKNGTFVKSIVQ
ncbi:Na(+)/H(+) antiporter [Lactiplantibacillus plantarum]|nr:Na(+)/H(+) antiporter [Lactiplantibacillus plantarum]